MSEPILVLTTGGTIDKQYFDALSRYQITDTTVMPSDPPPSARTISINSITSIRRSPASISHK